MASKIRKRRGNCEVTIDKIGKRIYMKCRNLRRTPTAEEIIDSLRKNKKILK